MPILLELGDGRGNGLRSRVRHACSWSGVSAAWMVWVTMVSMTWPGASCPVSRSVTRIVRVMVSGAGRGVRARRSL